MTSTATEIPTQGRILCIDIGGRRIGVAVSDETQFLATPLLVMKRGSRIEDFQRLSRLVIERNVVGIVVGHPLNADGSEGPTGRTMARYAQQLASYLQLPLVLWDEHGSTQAALERLAHAGRRRRQMPLDAEAAAVILQDYLDSRLLASAPGNLNEPANYSHG